MLTAKRDDFSGIKTLVFDYDGTLHNSICLYGPAFRKAFEFLVEVVPHIVQQSGYALNKQWTDDEISRWLGYTKDEMWAAFMPILPEDIKTRASKMIGEEMSQLLLKKQATLYPQALDTLGHLKERGYRLIFLSNCSVAYMEAHRRDFGLGAYFDTFACAGQYPGHSKEDILGFLIKAGLLSAATSVMIGDRAQDIEAGQGNGLKTIGCLYGFGRPNELKTATVEIEAIEDLLDLFL